MRAEWEGLKAIQERLNRLANLTDEAVAPLLDELRDIVTEDNRKGVLAGRDKSDQPMPETKYRLNRVSRTRARTRKQGFGMTRFGLQGDNLTSAEYRTLTGPPLAPRRDRSRVIANFVTRAGKSGQGRYFVEWGWANVVNAKGQTFLQYHFDGKGRLPKRDLRGVRPWGQERMKRALREWSRGVLKRG